MRNFEYMNRKWVLSICAILAYTGFSLSAQQWISDKEDPTFRMRYVSMPNDYSGKVRSTIINKNSTCAKGKAILYVHGYNDYFFQQEMANRFVDSCYNFYAVDLRKYGRSLLPGQRAFEVRDLKEYFPDLDSALNVMIKNGNHEIILMGHSTGGLISSYYMAQNAGAKYPIKGLILNSPFLDMNLSPFMEKIMVPMVSIYSKVFPNTNIDQGDSKAYAKSLLKKYNGEWSYNTNWKKEVSPAVTSGWLGAIHNAHNYIQKGTDIKIPILLMHSMQSVNGDEWTPEFNKGDAVLDVNDISLYGKNLGPKVQELYVKEGLHDLILSRKPVREGVYQYIFKWLHRNHL